MLDKHATNSDDILRPESHSIHKAFVYVFVCARGRLPVEQEEEVA